jgi:hypothetical protein
MINPICYAVKESIRQYAESDCIPILFNNNLNRTTLYFPIEFKLLEKIKSALMDIIANSIEHAQAADKLLVNIFLDQPLTRLDSSVFLRVQDNGVMTQDVFRCINHSKKSLEGYRRVFERYGSKICAPPLQVGFGTTILIEIPVWCLRSSHTTDLFTEVISVLNYIDFEYCGDSHSCEHRLLLTLTDILSEKIRYKERFTIFLNQLNEIAKSAKSRRIKTYCNLAANLLKQALGTVGMEDEISFAHSLTEINYYIIRFCSDPLHYILEEHFYNEMTKNLRNKITIDAKPFAPYRLNNHGMESTLRSALKWMIEDIILGDMEVGTTIRVIIKLEEMPEKTMAKLSILPVNFTISQNKIFIIRSRLRSLQISSESEMGDSWALNLFIPIWRSHE